jgi:hypothetical protein
VLQWGQAMCIADSGVCPATGARPRAFKGGAPEER